MLTFTPMSSIIGASFVMMQICMRATLDQIAEIRAGHPFRGAIKESIDGNGYVIQIRDQDEYGLITWDQVVKAQVVGRKEPEWLVPGDIVFAARGVRNLASVVREDDIAKQDAPVICSPHYFQLRINNYAGLLPEFLAWQLNQTDAQRYFQQSAEGSAQVSIRRNILEKTPIMLPSLRKQERMIKLAEIAMRERNIYQQLIELRRLEMDSVARQLLNDSEE